MTYSEVQSILLRAVIETDEMEAVAEELGLTTEQTDTMTEAINALVRITDEVSSRMTVWNTDEDNGHLFAQDGTKIATIAKVWKWVASIYPDGDLRKDASISRSFIVKADAIEWAEKQLLAN